MQALVLGLQPHDLRTSQQVAAKAVQIALKAWAVEIILQVPGVGGAADIEQIALRRDFALQRRPGFPRGFGKGGIGRTGRLRPRRERAAICSTSAAEAAGAAGQEVSSFNEKASFGSRSDAAVLASVSCA